MNKSRSIQRNPDRRHPGLNELLAELWRESAASCLHGDPHSVAFEVRHQSQMSSRRYASPPIKVTSRVPMFASLSATSKSSCVLSSLGRVACGLAREPQ